MPTAILQVAKSISQRIEDLIGTPFYKKTREVVEFSTLMTLPISIPFILMGMEAIC